MLVNQAHSCVQLVEDGELSEALVVLQSLSNALIETPISSDNEAAAFESQRIMDLLAQALAGATSVREDSRTKLLKLRNEQQVKAIYSASSLPH